MPYSIQTQSYSTFEYCQSCMHVPTVGSHVQEGETLGALPGIYVRT